MLELILREWRLLVHERPSVMFVLVCAASAYALLIGNLYRNETVQNIPVAVCDLDDTPLSRELIKAVMDADQYDYRETLTDEFVSVEKLRSGELAAVLIIPEDFAKKFYTQQPIDLAFLFVVENLSGIAALYFRTKIGMFDAVKWLSFLQPVHYIAMDFRDLTLVGENADIRSHVEIFWVGGMLTLMTFYAMFRYKLAQRLKRSTAD